MLRRKLPSEVTVVSVSKLLADKEGSPNSVSKEASAEEPTATLFSAVFDCGGRALLLSIGAPGDHPYHRFSW